MWRIVSGSLALLAACTTQPRPQIDYICGGGDLRVEVSAAYLAANPDVKLRVDRGVTMGVGYGTHYRHGGLWMGTTVPLRQRETTVQWPDGTKLTCVPDTRMK